MNCTLDLMSSMVQNTLHYGPELIYVATRVFFRYEKGVYDDKVSEEALQCAAIGAFKVHTYLRYLCSISN